MKTKTTESDLKQLQQLLTKSAHLFMSEETKKQEPPEPDVAPETRKKFAGLLALQKIARPDLDILTASERRLFVEFITREFAKIKDRKRDSFYEKIEDILLPDVNEAICENNRTKINHAIISLLKETGRMPAKSEIARETGLSRNTVIKHMQELEGISDSRRKEVHFVKAGIMESIVKSAVNGDMRAAKLYFGLMDKPKGSQTNPMVLNQQNNFVQINEVTFNPQQLSAEQLKAIEEIVKGDLKT